MLCNRFFLPTAIVSLMVCCANGMSRVHQRDILQVAIPVVFKDGLIIARFNLMEVPLLSVSGTFSSSELHAKIGEGSSLILGVGGGPVLFRGVTSVLIDLHRTILFVVERLTLICEASREKRCEEEPGTADEDECEPPDWIWAMTGAPVIDGLSSNLLCLADDIGTDDTHTLMRFIEVIELLLSAVPGQQAAPAKSRDLCVHLRWAIDVTYELLEQLSPVVGKHIPFWVYEKIYADSLPKRLSLHDFLANKLGLYARLFVVKK